MDALEEVCGGMGSTLGKGVSFDVGFGTDLTGFFIGVVKVDAFNGQAEPFYAGVPHEAVQKSAHSGLTTVTEGPRCERRGSLLMRASNDLDLG